MFGLDWLHDYANNCQNLWVIIGSLGSAATAIVAVVLASRERTDRKAAERDRDVARAAQTHAEQAEMRRAREAQARAVSVWVLRLMELGPDGGRRYRWTMGFGNYSNMPVLDIGPVVDGERIHLEGRGFRAVLHPKDKVEGPMGTEVASTEPGNDRIWVTFRDAAGTRWRRYADGRLEELPTDRTFGV